MKITGNWIAAEGLQQVCQRLTEAGHQALLVGGCVRNALLGVRVGDIDIATDARPDQVVALFSHSGFKVIPTGIEHGTVTVVAHGVPHEITTFRRDVETDGRRAVVAFSDDLTEDARRRDFTMNALYARADGTVLDPLGGFGDLEARRVRFVGDARDRLAEDYLRALRYFRFHAWYGDPQKGLDADALDAISRGLEGLNRLSRERVTTEITKLLSANDPGPAVAAMEQTGVLSTLLPGATARLLLPLLHVESLLGLAQDPILRLAALIPGGETDRLRLSKSDARALSDYAREAPGARAAAELGYRYNPQAAMGMMALRSAISETIPPENVQTEVARGAQARMPLTASDLMPTLSGAALGAALHRAEEDWIASDFTLERDELKARAFGG